MFPRLAVTVEAKNYIDYHKSMIYFFSNHFKEDSLINGFPQVMDESDDAYIVYNSGNPSVKCSILLETFGAANLIAYMKDHNRVLIVERLLKMV